MTKSQTPPSLNSEARGVVVNPSGPHQRDRCFTAVNASNTTSRGASMVRAKTISRSAVADCAALPLGVMAGLLLGGCLELLDVGVQSVEAVGPERREPACPPVHRTQTQG